MVEQKKESTESKLLGKRKHVEVEKQREDADKNE